MMFIEFNEFANHFPISNKWFASGGQGKIFKSNSSYAIKVFDDIVDFANEIHFVSKLDHSHILKPIAWSFDGKDAYLAMPLGKTLQKAIDDNDISKKLAVEQLQLAINYLHDMTIVHGDIDFDNAVLYNQKAMLIDFGCAQYSNDFYKDEKRLDIQLEKNEYTRGFKRSLLSNERQMELLIKRCLAHKNLDFKKIDLALLKLTCYQLTYRKYIDMENEYDFNHMVIDILKITNCTVFSVP